MTNIPKHIAIIMDGNRRWAKKRGLPSSMGHAEGANTLEKIADDCSDLGIKYLTVYAFSTENWKRSEEEVDYLMKLLAKHIKDFDKRIKNRDIRFRGIEERTKDKQGLTVNIAINYGGRAELTYMAKEIAKETKDGNISLDEIDENLISKHLQTKDTPDPDLIIRTGGENRLSGFLLWQAAYSELYFTDVLLPDFDNKELEKAINEYNNRKRNFGA